MFSEGNRKLQKTEKINNIKILSFDLPPKVTCPKAKECLRYCYAQTGFFVFKRKKQISLDNYELSQSENFVSKINDFLSQAALNT